MLFKGDGELLYSLSLFLLFSLFVRMEKVTIMYCTLTTMQYLIKRHVHLCKRKTLDQPSLTFLVLGTSFMEDNFYTDSGRGNSFQMIQAHYIYCVLYYSFISSTSDHQASDPEGWGPLIQMFLASQQYHHCCLLWQKYFFLEQILENKQHQ